MPSKSKAQQKFMGMVYSYMKGDMKDAPAAVKKVAKDMKKSDVKKYASTKHKGLPPKINQESMDVIKNYIKRKVTEIVTEANNDFNKKKMQKLVKQSKYLQRALKMIKGGDEETKLKRLYLNLVFKDKEFEPRYKKIR